MAQLTSLPSRSGPDAWACSEGQGEEARQHSLRFWFWGPAPQRPAQPKAAAHLPFPQGRPVWERAW